MNIRTVPGHIPAHLHAAYAAAPGHQDLPPYCPYRPGDPVQCHKDPGFRGWVIGNTADDTLHGLITLTGITTDGAVWTMPWGLLHRDGQPGDPWDRREHRRAERDTIRRRTAEERPAMQLDLFTSGE